MSLCFLSYISELVSTCGNPVEVHVVFSQLRRLTSILPCEWRHICLKDTEQWGLRSRRWTHKAKYYFTESALRQWFPKTSRCPGVSWGTCQGIVVCLLPGRKTAVQSFTQWQEAHCSGQSCNTLNHILRKALHHSHPLTTILRLAKAFQAWK